ncbi:SRPBCC family protein [Adhaeribacter aquaticus]|uniref:SRPBCC family protein n=1 Tax=Adhaeribacter aquaticus TaxID=299567 RepID=UPI000412F026|nr:SRPBCC family protein [Adhaeribacter aquaticus]
MSFYTLERIQRLPINLETAWDFFSSPHNLNRITPPEMSMEVISYSGSAQMYEGQIITYNISPFLNLKLFWMTEITHVKEKQYFVDEQRFGPYSFWHHTHFFKEVEGGVEMRDQVHYKLPFGFLGQLVHALLVKKKLNKIFDYRYKVLDQEFGKFL